MKPFNSSNTLTISLHNGSFELIYLFQQIVRNATKLKLHLSTQRTGQAFIFNYQLISLSVRCNSGGGKTPTWFIKLSENGCVCKKKKRKERHKNIWVTANMDILRMISSRCTDCAPQGDSWSGTSVLAVPLNPFWLIQPAQSPASPVRPGPRPCPLPRRAVCQHLINT